MAIVPGLSTGVYARTAAEGKQLAAEMERILQQVVAEQRLKHVRRVVLCGCGGGGWGSSGVGVGQQQPLRRVTNVGDFIGILPPMFICLKEVLAGATLDSSGTIRLSSEAWKDKPQVFKADLIAEYEQLMGAALLTNDNRNANGFGKFKKFPVYVLRGICMHNFDQVLGGKWEFNDV